MASQLDLDQGGTQRQWVLSNMGPSIGLVRVPLQNILDITAAGTYAIDPSTSLIRVNSTSAVTITLPSCANPSYSGAGTTQPGVFAKNAIVIADVGGNASTATITIKQNNAGETILGLASVTITHNYGAYILQPIPLDLTWISVAV